MDIQVQQALITHIDQIEFDDQDKSAIKVSLGALDEQNTLFLYLKTANQHSKRHLRLSVGNWVPPVISTREGNHNPDFEVRGASVIEFSRFPQSV